VVITATTEALTTTTAESPPTPDTTTTTTPAPPTTQAQLPSNPILLQQAIDDNPITAVAAAIEVYPAGDALEEFFDVLAASDLSDAEKQQIVNVLTYAPDEIKEQFEESINVFEGGFDSYVPSGSNLTVAERRVIVAVGALLSAVPVAPVVTGSTNTRRRA